MNTFLTYPNIQQTARSLDSKRLGKQRLETLQLLNTMVGCKLVAEKGINLTDWRKVKLSGLSKGEREIVKKRRLALARKKSSLKLKGWVNHPARLVWVGHEKALARYGLIICKEWERRGYVENIAPHIAVLSSHFPDTGWPDWVFDPNAHLLMRQSLRFKEVVDNAKLVAKGKEAVWWYRDQWPSIEPIYGYAWSQPDRIRHLTVPEDKAILSVDWI